MSKQVKIRRGTAAQHASFTGVEGEITVDTTNDTIRVHDGATVGGHMLAKVASPTFTGIVTFATTKSIVVTVSASSIDCATGNYFTKTASGALSWTVNNVPTGAYSFILELTNGGTGTQTWFTGIKWPGGTAPTLAASGVDLLGFITDDGGATWRGVQLMKDSK